MNIWKVFQSRFLLWHRKQNLTAQLIHWQSVKTVTWDHFWIIFFFKSTRLVTRLPWLGLWRHAVGSDNARQNFAVVTTMEETDPGLSQLGAFSKLSIQIFIHASSHLRRDKHEFHFCSKLLISWPLCRWQRGFGAPPTLPRQSVTQQLCPAPTEYVTEAVKWEPKNYSFAKTRNCTIFYGHPDSKTHLSQRLYLKKKVFHDPYYLQGSGSKNRRKFDIPRNMELSLIHLRIVLCKDPSPIS